MRVLTPNRTNLTKRYCINPPYYEINTARYQVTPPQYIQSPSINNRWEYDVFLQSTLNGDVKHVDITQDQKKATILFYNNTEKTIILPEGYDHINFLINNHVQVNIHPNTTVTQADVALLAMQLGVLATYENKNKQIHIDFLNGMYKAITGTYHDFTNVCNVIFALVMKYEDMTTDIETCPTSYPIICHIIRMRRKSKIAWKRFIKKYF